MNAPLLYRRHRFPSEVISHCVWLYFRFSISYRDVEEMMAMRGLTLTYETIQHGEEAELSAQMFGIGGDKPVPH